MKEVFFWLTIPFRLIIIMIVCLFIPFILLNEMIEERYKCGIFYFWGIDCELFSKYKKLHFTGIAIGKIGIGIIKMKNLPK